MRWLLSTAPQHEPIQLSEALKHCNLDDQCEPSESVYVAGLISKARSFAEQKEDRQLITATWLAYMDRFPVSNQVLEIRGRLPLQSVTSISYLKEPPDAGDPWTEWDAEEYQVDAVDRDRPGRIRPNTGYVWPTAPDALNAVRLELACGYGDEPTDVPESIRTGLLYLVAQMYAVREPISTMRIEAVPGDVMSLAMDLMCWGDYR